MNSNWYIVVVLELMPLLAIHF